MPVLGANNGVFSTTLGPRVAVSIRTLTYRMRFLRNFFQTWLRLDVAQVAVMLGVLGTVSGVFTRLYTDSTKFRWWLLEFCTSSISIISDDSLYYEVLEWIRTNVDEVRGTRFLSARTAGPSIGQRSGQRSTFESELDKIRYLATPGPRFFWHERRPFLVRQADTGRTPPRIIYSEDGPRLGGSEDTGTLDVICLGLSPEPIKGFLDACRKFSKKSRDGDINIRQPDLEFSGSRRWGSPIQKSPRDIETVYFDAKVKAQIVADLTDYLSADKKQFYIARGIPYRRGYLLYGPAGTGKTSLTLALAGKFELDLYLVHLPTITSDEDLSRLFSSLPSRCIVLLEDIDAVGRDRDDPVPEEKHQNHWGVSQRTCTLAGLLNILDGVASAEGRVVFMTSNFPEKLDRALIRPGRVDKMILLGYINRDSAKMMFMTMFQSDQFSRPLDKEEKKRKLESFATQFSEQIPEDKLTPAQLQGYLLGQKDSPELAATNIAAWVEQELLYQEQRKNAKSAPLKMMNTPSRRLSSATSVSTTTNIQEQNDGNKSESNTVMFGGGYELEVSSPGNVLLKLPPMSLQVPIKVTKLTTPGSSKESTTADPNNRDTTNPVELNKPTENGTEAKVDLDGLAEGKTTEVGVEGASSNSEEKKTTSEKC